MQSADVLLVGSSYPQLSNLLDDVLQRTNVILAPVKTIGLPRGQGAGSGITILVGQLRGEGDKQICASLKMNRVPLLLRVFDIK
jgi:hypothetical protein